MTVSGYGRPDIEAKPFTTSDADIENAVPGLLQVHLLSGVRQLRHFVFFELKKFHVFLYGRVKKSEPFEKRNGV
jgi:hypothetical protein